MQLHTQLIRNLIIGAGPAGLAVAGRLRHAGEGFVLIEKTEHVGERWRHHYDRLHLHTVKQWSHLPHLPFPEEYPQYVSKEQLINYFESYAIHFDIHPQFGVDALKIRKTPDGTWEVLTNRGHLRANHVFVSTGLNRFPYSPVWDGMDRFNGTIMHSIDYRNPAPFSGKRALVIGMGNTGAEIALDLSESGIPTWISVRGTLNIVPRDLNGLAVQVTAKRLASIPMGIGDWIGRLIQNIYYGDLSKYGLKRSSQNPLAQVRKTGRTPVIDIGTIKAIKEGKIQVVGGIKRFEPNGVILENGELLKCDNVILATGYRPRLEDLVEGIAPHLDHNGYPPAMISSDALSGLYFIGFDNYKPGGVLGTINIDSETVVKAMLEKSQIQPA